MASRRVDLVVRGGTVVDGSGGEPFAADVAISGEHIVEVGRVRGRGRAEIDARGLTVTPGFVDIHTHYDGQATWGDRLTPSSVHGVTTVLMGNCGVGFAPCRRSDHERLIHLMEGVEDIPEPVMTEGLRWDWESFSGYLDALERRPHDIDVATQVPHSALRVFVMGQRGADREPATPRDLAQMAQLTREAIEAGALGFATSRTINHRTSEGKPIPTLAAAETELMAIGAGMAEAGRGVLQLVCDFTSDEHIRTECAMMRRLVRATGRPLSVSVGQLHEHPDGWRLILQLIEEARAAGLPIKGQVFGRPVAGFLGLELSLHPFSLCPSYQAIAGLPLREKRAALRDPGLRRRLLAEPPDSASPFAGLARHFAEMYPFGDPPDYEPSPQTSVEREALRRGVRSEELAYDLLLERDGRGLLFVPLANFADHTLNAPLAMMRHPDTILGLGDGGAHCGMICDGSYPTFLLTYWVRDRTSGEKLPLPRVIRALSRDTAQAVGLGDRGLIAPGYKADLNLIELEKLRLWAPKVEYDLPAGGRRLTQRADGYRATVVAGTVTYRDGEPTGALPGRLVRGARNRPAAPPR